MDIQITDLTNEYKERLAETNEELVMARATIVAQARLIAELQSDRPTESESLSDNGKGDVDKVVT